MTSSFASVAILLFTLLVDIQASRAGNATWNLNPTSDDWNSAMNWTPSTVPNGPADVATFYLSHQTGVSISNPAEVDGIVFEPGADAFTINTMPAVVLTISGAGVNNSSGALQNFINQEGKSSSGELHFSHSATAGDSVVYTNQTSSKACESRSSNSKRVLRPGALSSLTWPPIM